MKKFKGPFLVFLIILMMGFLFHRNYINEFPSHIHAWSQSDRYAIALGFVNNGLNFFKPETFLYYHPLFFDVKTTSNQSITAVDFPVHDYFAAIIMKTTGDNSPWIFRLYTLLYSFAGLFFLFRLSLLFTKDIYKSAFVAIFASTSPVFVYYQAGFIPSMPSLSNAFIGMYFYARFIYTGRNRYFNLTLLFLVLAALSRTTFLIPLIAVWGG